MKEFFNNVEKPVFSISPFVTLLVILSFSDTDLGWRCSGFLFVFVAFHIPVNLIWAIVWLTDSILVFLSRSFVFKNGASLDRFLMANWAIYTN